MNAVFVIGLLSFAVVALAAKQIGQLFQYFRLPLISGFLFTGIVAGPFLINLIHLETLEYLHFVDEIALAFIAFTAGSELFLKELKHLYKSIIWVTLGLVTFTLSLGILAVMLLAKYIPFMQNISFNDQLAIAILVGTILIARSPSVAIALINELRAKGPFTQTVLGVTVITDVVVITLFALNASVATTLLTGHGFDLSLIVEIGLELLISILLGYLIKQILVLIMASLSSALIKIAAILTIGYLSFWFTSQLALFAHNVLPFKLSIEPLLICMLAGFLLTNFSNYRNEFSSLLRNSSLPIYVAFFTLVGASLGLDVLVKTWPIALALFSVRLIGIFLGSLIGGMLAGTPWQHNRIRWMALITQAGVGLGLAKEMAGSFPDWGPSIATIIISVIILNELAGPLFFKWAITLAREAHIKAQPHEFDGVRDTIIFGLERQAFVLARQLQAHHWQVKIAATKAREDSFAAEDVEIELISQINLESLKKLGMEHADAVVCLLLSDEENYQICELIYEHFGIETLVVRLNDRANLERFQELGALIVDPSLATVQLLEEFVRSPSTTSLLLGMESSQDIAEVEIRDPNLHCILLRDIRLPLDTLVLSVKRQGKVLISHGYTRLELGDKVTVVGSKQSLEEVMLRFGIIDAN